MGQIQIPVWISRHIPGLLIDRMALGHRHQKLFLEHQMTFHIRPHVRCIAQKQVDLKIFDLLVQHALNPLIQNHIHIGKFLLIGRHHRRKQPGCAPCLNSDPDAPRVIAGNVLKLLLELLLKAQHGPGLFHIALPRIGQDKPFPNPLEQLHVQALFQVVDVNTQRRLRYVQLLRRPGNTPAFRKHAYILLFLHIHTVPPSFHLILSGHDPLPAAGGCR